MFNNLSDTGQFGFSNHYLSNPVAGRKNIDILYTTGVGHHV